MKKICAVFILLLFVIFIQGCVDVGFETSEKIVAPQNMSVPLKGTWNIKDYMIIGDTGYDESELKGWISKNVYFDQEKVIFDEEYYENPNYKLRNIKAGEYFLYAHKLDCRQIGVEDVNVQVISVTSNDIFVNEFVKISDDLIITCVDNILLFLKRPSDDHSELAEENTNHLIEQEENERIEQQKGDTLSSCVLLGLKSIDKSHGDVEQANYRTLWIASKDMIVQPILEISDLFVPRDKGFWQVGSNIKKSGKQVYDQLYAYPAFNDSAKSKNVTHDIARRKIMFLGSDYIAVETSNKGIEKLDNLEMLQVIPMDNLGNDNGVKISDVVGDRRGYDAMLASASTCLALQSKDVIQKLEQTPTEESFTLSRRNGQWIVRGRLNGKGQTDEKIFVDFDINIISPSKMVSYDKLHISWNTIKANIPDADDAFTSPNKDIALIISDDVLYVYILKDGNLSKEPAKKIKLKENEQVVMAEWATGNYVEKWEKSFSNGVRVIDGAYIEGDLE
ncbi:MAG: hypothetical protein PHP06_06480 [Clostridia bacterium]|nr:hypothetical protein [Clostridia bacterium]